VGHSIAILMRQIWLIFSQAVTVLVAALFVLATFQPDWLSTRSLFPARVSVVQAPATTGTLQGLSAAAQVAMPAVASITATRRETSKAPDWHGFLKDEEDESGDLGMGSAVVVSADGFLLTNHHVIDGSDDIQIRLADGREAPAEIVGTDPDTDIAVLKIKLADLPVMALGQTGQLRVGDAVLAIGNPFNVGQTVTAGIVSALGRSRLGLSTYENFIQTDAAINPGNSGGALVDARGALLGINTAIYSQSGGNMGIGFAVPIELAQEVMASLIRDGRVVRGWLGVETRELSADLAEQLGLKGVRGVLLAGIQKGGPAAQAGIQAGDVVQTIQGREVVNPEELLRAIASLRPGTETPVRLLRQGRSMTVQVTLAERPADLRRR
jgi:serine protease DegQ